MRPEEEIRALKDYYQSPFETRINNDIYNSKFNRIECTDYIDRIIVLVCEWVLNESEEK